MGGHDSSEHRLLVELDVVEGLEGKVKVAEKAVDTQEADNGEVAKHAVEALGAVVASDSHGILIATASSKLFCNIRSLDQGVEDVQDAVAAPRVWVLTQNLELFLVACLSGKSQAVGRKRVELVDELIDNVPCPVVLLSLLALCLFLACHCATHGWRLEVDGALRVEDEVEQAAVGVIALELDLERCGEVEGLGGGGQS